MAQDHTLQLIVKIDKPIKVPKLRAFINRILRSTRLMAAPAEIIRREVVSRAPMRTGALKKSISVTQEGPEHFKIRAGVYYAGFVEFGTRKMAPQPFMRGGMQAVRGKALHAYIQAIRRLKR